MRGVMFQYFEWNCPADGQLWNQLATRAEELKKLNVTAVWLPPPCKAMGGKQDNGYAIYDLYDLGEFDQKATVATKFGTKAELLTCIKTLQKHGLHVYADTVLNHKMGGDETEKVMVRELNGEDQSKVESEPYEAEVWSRYLFVGRGGKYSSFTYNKSHFTAFGSKVGGDPEVKKVYLVAEKSLSPEVTFEDQNNDYLLGEDLDLFNDEVRSDLFSWGKWFVETTGIDGFRLDAVKHMAPSFYKDWLAEMRKAFPEKELFAVGEYSDPKVEALQHYLTVAGPVMSLLDIPLQYHFNEASIKGAEYDLTKIFEGSLVAGDPVNAVTFVESHDTQLHQSDSHVRDWFKMSAYAFILLRKEGYPSIFYGDYYGNQSEEHKLTSFKAQIDTMVELRMTHMHGDKHDYLDNPNCVGWVWSGNDEHPGALVVVMSNSEAAAKKMTTFRGKVTFFDATGNIEDEITTDEHGEAEFRCNADSVSVWQSR